MDNKIIKEINLLCNLVFNQNCTKVSFLLPDIFKKYRFESRLYSLKEIYFLIKEKIEKLDIHSVQLQNIDIPQMKNMPKKLEKVVSIYNNNQCFDYIIHGSYSDDTYTEASDVDDFIIIKKETFESFKNFKKVYYILKMTNLHYQYVDPVQHHGHWIVTEFDLLDYDNSVIPIFVLIKNSFSIGRKITISYSLVENKKIDGIFNMILDELRCESMKLFANKINIFSLKNLISAVTLLIPLHYQLKGLDLDKKEAIERAKIEFDMGDLELLEWSTQLRNNWSSVRGYRYYIWIRMFNWLFQNRSLTVFLSGYFLPKIGIDEIPDIKKTYLEKFIYRIKSI